MPVKPSERIPTLITRARYSLFSGPAGAVFRGMATLAAGSIAARVIGLASIPIVTRLYGPEDFGALAVFTSFIVILAPVITLRYVLAMPLPRRDGMAINLLALSSCIMLVMSLLLALALWSFGEQLLALFSMQQISPYWWLIVLGLLGTAGHEMLSLWATRKRAYKPIAQTTAIQSLLGNIVKIGFGLFAIKPLGLLIGQVIMSGGGIGSLWLHFNKDFSSNAHFISRRRMAIVAGRYRHFPVYRLPSQFLLIFSAQAPILFFANIYDAEVTGNLSMALIIIAIPMSLLGKSMSNAYYAEAAYVGKNEPGKLRQITKQVVSKLFFLSLLPAFVLFNWGPELFSLFLGDNWRNSGEFASLLSIYLVAQFVTSPVITIFNVLEKHVLFLAINAIRVLGLIFIFIVLPHCFSVSEYQLVLFYSFYMAFLYMSVYGFVVAYLKKLESKV